MSKRVALALTWVAATCVAVFVALQAVSAIGDQVTDTANASGRQPTTISSPSSTTASTAVTTTPAAPAPAADPGAPSGASSGGTVSAAGGGTGSPSAPAEG